MKFNIKPLCLILSILGLVGCVTGSQYRADSYDASLVNTEQEAIPVKILAIRPAKVQVDNTEAKRNAQIIGAIGGAFLGAAVADNRYGVLAGGATGLAAGSLVNDKALVDGVSLIFKENGRAKRPKTSTQVGRICEFTLGDAFMFRMRQNETRIQPNNPTGCPKG